MSSICQHPRLKKALVVIQRWGCLVSPHSIRRIKGHRHCSSSGMFAPRYEPRTHFQSTASCLSVTIGEGVEEGAADCEGRTHCSLPCSHKLKSPLLLLSLLSLLSLLLLLLLLLLLSLLLLLFLLLLFSSLLLGVPFDLYPPLDVSALGPSSTLPVRPCPPLLIITVSLSMGKRMSRRQRHARVTSWP